MRVNIMDIHSVLKESDFYKTLLENLENDDEFI